MSLVADSVLQNLGNFEELLRVVSLKIGLLLVRNWHVINYDITVVVLFEFK